MWLKNVGGKSGEKKVRLLCCGHAGSSYVDFTQWYKHLPSSVEVLAVSLPGRCERIKEEPLTDIDILTNEIVTALEQLPALPTIMFGHSFGAVLAYEIAALCTKKSTVPASVVLSASALDKATLLDNVNTEDMSEVLHVFKQRGYLSEEQAENQKLMELILPYLLADIMCKEKWHIESDFQLNTPIHSIAWAEDALVEPQAVHKWSTKSTRAAECQKHTLTGKHLEYLNAPASFFQIINQCISQVAV